MLGPVGRDFTGGMFDGSSGSIGGRPSTPLPSPDESAQPTPLPSLADAAADYYFPSLADDDGGVDSDYGASMRI